MMCWRCKARAGDQHTGLCCVCESKIGEDTADMVERSDYNLDDGPAFLTDREILMMISESIRSASEDVVERLAEIEGKLDRLR